MPDPLTLTGKLARLIETSGPISVARYMAEANAHYYGTRDPLGQRGDFTTAPEISQMFGELIGVWLADMWARAGHPDAHYVELGPGRGTLAADALRAMRSVGLKPQVHLVETSMVLRKSQAAQVSCAVWHRDVDTLPVGVPLLIVANEFFDVLPVRQLVATESGWRERVVVHQDGSFVPLPGPRVGSETIPPHIRNAPPATMLETSPASADIMKQLARLIACSGGVALIVDYGHLRTAPGETLQAVAAHTFADPWTDPGDRDLTAHVDFEALCTSARRDSVRVLGPVTQGEWLSAMGIEHRAASLARAASARRDEVAIALRRLTSSTEMGSLFKFMALVASDWPEANGFQNVMRPKIVPV